MYSLTKVRQLIRVYLGQHGFKQKCLPVMISGRGRVDSDAFKGDPDLWLLLAFCLRGLSAWVSTSGISWLGLASDWFPVGGLLINSGFGFGQLGSSWRWITGFYIIGCRLIVTRVIPNSWPGFFGRTRVHVSRVRVFPRWVYI